MADWLIKALQYQSVLWWAFFTTKNWQNYLQHTLPNAFTTMNELNAALQQMLVIIMFKWVSCHRQSFKGIANGRESDFNLNQRHGATPSWITNWMLSLETIAITAMATCGPSYSWPPKKQVFSECNLFTSEQVAFAHNSYSGDNETTN